MKEKTKRFDIHTVQLFVFIMIGVAVNTLLAYLVYKLGLPLYFDTAATIGVSAIAGSFPGIAVAMLTNVFCGSFNPLSVYFGLINVLIAFLATYFERKGRLKKAGGVIVFILIASLSSGILSAICQWLLIGAPQHAEIENAARTLSRTLNIPMLPAFVLSNISINIVDKGISTGLALLMMKALPKKVFQVIRESKWRQKPLSDEELRSSRMQSEQNGHSLQNRMFWMLFAAAASLTVIMTWISVQIYFENAKKEYIDSARQAVKTASSFIDPEMVDTYLEEGREAPGYEMVERLLYGVRDNAQGVKYLYVLRIKEDGCHVIFDLETEDTPAYGVDDVIPFEEAFMPYLPDLFAGKEIEPIESDDISGWVMTVYHPLYDASGHCVCYVCADMSMQYLSSYVRNYLLRALLGFSGFFILILSFGLWMSRTYLVYPINSMAACTSTFVYDREHQESMQDNVNAIKRLEIATDDELEHLYQVLCTMTSDMTQQMQDIDHYSKTVAQMQNGLIITMADMVENRDSDTGAHVQKTAAYVRIILDGLKQKGYYAKKLTPKYMSDVEMSAPLHDVGKINISDVILNKPGKLTDEEYEIMKTHTTYGKEIMEKAISTVRGENYLKEARNMAAYHHERWDGKGYPDGLYGEVIPLSARIMAVADVFDALSSKRVYKPAMPLEQALAIIEEGAGTQFDPKVVEVFMDSLDEVKRVLQKYEGLAY